MGAITLGLGANALALGARGAPATGHPSILTLDGPGAEPLEDGTLQGILIDGVTYTEDAAGQPITIAALQSGPVCLRAPGIGAGDLVIGDTATAQAGLWVYDLESGAPVITRTWFLDGATTRQTGLTYVSDFTGALTLQERATQASAGSRVAISDPVAVTAGRFIADVIADFGGDYFDFGDLTHMYQSDAATHIDSDGQSVGRVDGQAGEITLTPVSGSVSPVTYDAATATLEFDGTSRGLWTAPLDIGEGFSVVARVIFDDVSGLRPVVLFQESSTDRAFNMRLNDGSLQTVAFDASNTGSYNTHSETLSAGIPYTLTSRADGDTGDIIAQVDGQNRSVTSLPTPLVFSSSEPVTIGWRQANFLDGKIARLVLIPTQGISDTDLTILENWVGDPS